VTEFSAVPAYIPSFEAARSLGGIIPKKLPDPIAGSSIRPPLKPIFSTAWYIALTIVGDV